MKTLIISHVDLDGTGVAIMWKKIYPDADVMFVDYGWENDSSNIEKLDQYDEILIGDMSCSPELARILDKSSKSVVLCDHHDSAIRKFTESDTVYNWMHLDTNKCGTKIVHDLEMGLSDYDDLAEVINDYDLWILKDPRSIQLQFLHNELGQEQFMERFLHNPTLDFNAEEWSIIESKEDTLNESIRVAKESMSPDNYIDYHGKVFNYCSNVPHLLSLTAHHILDERPDLDYLLLNGGYGSISLRSKKFHINKLAEELGGGGHPLAAGFPIGPTTDVIASVLNRKLTDYSFVDKFKKKDGE